MTTIVSRWRARRLDQEDGLSLVELMIALMIMGVALLALASVAAASLVQVRNSRTRQQAVDAASAAIERLRLEDFAAVAMDGSDPGVQALGGCAGAFAEPTVESGVASSVPFESAAAGGVTVRMLVTWYDDPATGDQSCSDTAHDRIVKRVTATATWTDANGTRTVEQSTLVSDVGRGLAAPDFRLGTARVQMNWTQPMVLASAEVCTGHVLRNIGAQDGYEWFIERIDGGSPIRIEKKDGTSRAEFKNTNGRWTARAFFEYPARTTPTSPSTYQVPWGATSPDPTQLPPDVDLMWDADGNGAPETVHRLDPGDQARVWICYRPDPPSTSTYAVADYAREFRVTVRSRFDPNRFEQVTHGLSVAPSNLRRLYLFDDYSGAAAGGNSPRLIPTNNGNNRSQPTYPMGPVSPQGLQPTVLDTTSSIPNHDTDVDSYGLRGLRLKPLLPDPEVEHTWTRPSGGTASDSFDIGYARWHAPYSAIAAGSAGTRATLDTPVTLRLWMSTLDMLRNDAQYDRTVSLAIKVQVVNRNETTVDRTLYELTSATPFVYTHPYANRGQFIAVPITFNFPSTQVIQDTQYLRLEVRCVSAVSTGTTRQDECVIGYDHTSVASYLEVQIVSTSSAL